MKTTIYCFSATGNSLTTARKIAENLENCQIVSAISARRQTKVIEDADAVGFVFPVYYGDMPCIVRELISKMVFRADTYIFSVVTCRGHAGACNQRMDQLLKTRGQKLSFAAAVKMPGNSFINAPEVDAAHLAAQNDAVCNVTKRIAAREVEDYFDATLLPLAQTAYPNNFRGIIAENKCTGCGLCTKLCPMDNIAIIDNHAYIGDNCATCLACFHWCPVEAIWMSKQENIARRAKYHHPEISVNDILAQKGNNR